MLEVKVKFKKFLRPYLLRSEYCQFWYCPITLLLAVWEAVEPCHIHGIHIRDGASCRYTKLIIHTIQQYIA